jgi:hypothetical protein
MKFELQPRCPGTKQIQNPNYEISKQFSGSCEHLVLKVSILNIRYYFELRLAA